MTTRPQDSPDPKKARTKAATVANMRRREERAADLLFSRGWGLISPYPESSAAREEAHKAMIDQAVKLLSGAGWQVVRSTFN